MCSEKNRVVLRSTKCSAVHTASRDRIASPYVVVSSSVTRLDLSSGILIQLGSDYIETPRTPTFSVDEALAQYDANRGSNRSLSAEYDSQGDAATDQARADFSPSASYLMPSFKCASPSPQSPVVPANIVAQWAESPEADDVLDSYTGSDSAKPARADRSVSISPCLCLCTLTCILSSRQDARLTFACPQIKRNLKSATLAQILPLQLEHQLLTPPILRTNRRLLALQNRYLSYRVPKLETSRKSLRTRNGSKHPLALGWTSISIRSARWIGI